MKTKSKKIALPECAYSALNLLIRNANYYLKKNKMLGVAHTIKDLESFLLICCSKGE